MPGETHSYTFERLNGLGGFPGSSDPHESDPRRRMTISTWITMIVVITFVWGGCALALSTAIRKEASKPDE